jgi:hypothetical protein
MSSLAFSIDAAVPTLFIAISIKRLNGLLKQVLKRLNGRHKQVNEIKLKAIGFILPCKNTEHYYILLPVTAEYMIPSVRSTLKI